MATEAAREAMTSRNDFACLSPEVDGRTLRLFYQATGLRTAHKFREVIKFPFSLDAVEPTTLHGLLRLLTLAASLSYFKAFAPATFSVPGGLTETERRFVHSVTVNGLGEFAYVNDLPEVFGTAIDAPSLDPLPLTAATEYDTRRALVAVGGGKDSIVSVEALKSAGVETELFSVNSYGPIEATASVAALPLNTVSRKLDPGLFKLNRAGAPNGHVPVTAVNSILALITAAAGGFDTVVFSNEASSSYGNFVWEGREINHQWSKGLEFERLLRESVPTGAPAYLSFLRPLTELRIARRFADYDKYHRAFTSCNRAFKLRKEDRISWCADCPKCRFVFLCLAPFMPRGALLDIFSGRDMFADREQFEGFLELLAVDSHLKPFECVGEPDECRVALTLLRDHPDWASHPFLASPELGEAVADEAEIAAVFAFHGGEHFLSPRLEAVARAV